ncbi:uncharacterized protein LOC132269630 [Cornus florida]|uniref:uncharacterized protein LOC132269630 n=1 Tax=Cornus florida TaxID=4283 RepID=UPI0028A09DC6|nr:uncharacterized protein LOC132269630 [Cornus florida]
MEEISWCQKSRALWLKEGDQLGMVSLRVLETNDESGGFGFYQGLQSGQKCSSSDEDLPFVVCEKVSRGSDDILWVPSSHERFGVRSMFLCLSNFVGPAFPWKTIWCSKAPLTVAFFVWIVVWKKILMLDNLRKSGNTIVNWCCLCKRDEESVDHIFMHCPTAYDCWNLIFDIFGIHWVMPQSSKGLINAWRGCLVRSHARDYWRIVPHFVWWCIWKERNNRIFKGKESPLATLKLHILRSIFCYVKGSACSSTDNLVDLLDTVGP